MIPAQREWGTAILATLVFGLSLTMGSSEEIEEKPPTKEERATLYIWELLDCERRPSDWAEVLDARIKAGEPMPSWPEPKKLTSRKPTPDELLVHWRQRARYRNDERPDPAQRNALLAAAIAKPAAIEELLDFFPQTEAAARQVAGVLDKLPAQSNEDRKSNRTVRAWIYRHTGLLEDEVVADANHADWNNYLWDEQPDWTLDALQHRDAMLATKVLTKLAAGSNPGVATAAAHLLLESAPEEEKPKWRAQLIKAAVNMDFPEEARGIAVETLLAADWPQREAWILDYLGQAGVEASRWCRSAAYHAPEYWIPLLLPLVDGENRTAHTAALHLLADLGEHPKALTALLPWLDHPDWDETVYYPGSRLEVFRALEEVRIPEAIPGLKWALANDTDDFIVAAAATALANAGVKDTVPAMKEALDRLPDIHPGDDIVDAILKLDGYDDVEILPSLEAYYRACPTEDAQEDFHHKRLNTNPGAKAWAGRHFAANLPDDPALHQAIRRRADAVAGEDRQLSGNLRDALLHVPGEGKTRSVATMLRNGQLPPIRLAKVLHQCGKDGWDGEPFRELTKEPGLTGAFAAVLSTDPEAMARVLHGNDPLAQAALLAAAVHAESELDAGRVARFLDAPKELLQETADDYLFFHDTAASRKARLAWKRKNHDFPWHPQRGTFGNYEDFVDLAKNRYSLTTGPEEVFELSGFAHGGTISDSYVLCWPDFGIAVRNDEDRIFTGRMTKEQMLQLHEYVRKYRFDDLPRLEMPIVDGVEYSYVHATRDDIHLVWMDNPPTNRPTSVPSVAFFDREFPYSKGIVIYGQLVNLFDDLFSEVDLTLASGPYGPGVEVIISRDQAHVRTVWKDGDDLRVLVERRGSSDIWKGVSLETRTLTGLVPEPDACPVHASREHLHPGFNRSDYHFRYPWQVRFGDQSVHSGRFEGVAGIWLCRKAKEPDLVAPGTYLGELVTPDGKWCVAAKAVGHAGWAKPNGAVRINLATREVFPIDLPAADNFDTLGFVPSRGKFLVRRVRDWDYGQGKKTLTGPEEPESHFVDPATGALEPTDGTFWFSTHTRHFRPPQASSTKDEVWAAEFGALHGEDGATAIVLYNTREFTKRVVQTVEGIDFRSMDMWVDEAEGAIYAAANGDLIRVGLKR